MSKDNSAVTEVVLDKTVIDYVLPLLTKDGDPMCRSCGKKVTRNSFGAAVQINNTLTIWHNNIVCLMAFIKAREQA